MMRFALPGFSALLAAAALLVAAVPLASAQTAGWQPGPGAILDNTYDGYVDTPRAGSTVPAGGSFVVSGWFVDKLAQGWAGADDIEVWSGTMNGGGQMLARAQIAQNRPDVAAATGNPYWAASGFGALVPGSSVPAGNQTLNVYAHTGGKGWWFKSVTVVGGGASTSAAAAPAPVVAAAPATSGGAPQLTVSSPYAGQNVSTKSDFTITGSVNDPGNVDRIEVWINGERNADGATLLGTTTAGSDGSWSVTFKPTRFASMHTNLYAYAHNRATGLETEVNRDINIVDR